MNRMKVFILFLISFNLIFAEDVKPDSLHWNTNLLKRQKLFFAASDNWIPPMFSEVRKITTEKNDTLEKQYTLWQRIGFSAGVSRDVYWQQKHLSDEEAFTFMNIGAFFYRWFGLNSVNASISYRINDKFSGEIAGSWGRVNLRNRHGLYRYIPSEEFGDTLYNADGNIETTDWELVVTQLSIGVMKYPYAGRIYYNLSHALTKENLYKWGSTYLGSAWVDRWCKGLSVGLKWYPFVCLNGYIKPSITLDFGFAKEYKNNAPWQWEWKEKLYVGLSGICFGINLCVGGAR